MTATRTPKRQPARRSSTPRRPARRKRQDQNTSETVDLLIAAAEQRAEEQKRAAKSRTFAQRVAARGQDGGSAIYRLRHHLKAWLIAGGLFALVGIAQLLKLVADPLQVTIVVAGLVWFTLGLLALIVRTKVSRRRRGWWITIGLVAAGWTTAATYLGLSWETAAVGMVAFYGCAARWWMWHRYGYPDGPPPKPAEPGQQVPGVPKDIGGRWRAYVSVKHGYLPGAYLTNHTSDDISESWTLTIPPDGNITYGELLAKLPRLSLALGVPEDQLLIEKHPCGEPGLYVLKVIQESPVAEAVAMTDPAAHRSGDDLWITPATFVDGGRASIDLATTNSGWSLFCVGGVGSGKSSAMNVMLINALSSGCVTHWYIDGQWGASSPLLAKTADWAALTPEDAEDMLQALEKLAAYRSWENKVRGLEGFTPSPERPLLIVQVDECHAVWETKEQAERWANLLRIFRKIGIIVWAASQSGNLQATFGGSKMLRSRLCDRNAIVLYSSEKNGRLTIDGLEDGIEPSSVPKGIPGRGFLATPQRDAEGKSTGEVRIAQMRFDYMSAGADDQEQLLEVFAQYPSCQLEPVALKGIRKAVGDRYDRRHQIAAERRESELAMFAELMAGTDIDLSALIPDLTIASTETGIDDDEEISVGEVADAVPALTLAELLPTQRTTHPATHSATDDTGAATADNSTEHTPDGVDDVVTAGPAAPPVAEPDNAQHAILTALADGADRPSEITASTGYSDKHVRNHLKALVKTGHITKVGYGRYQPTNNDRPAHRRQILDALAAGQARPADIAAATGSSQARIAQLLDELAADGLALRGHDGSYVLAVHNPTPDSQTTG